MAEKRAVAGEAAAPVAAADAGSRPAVAMGPWLGAVAVDALVGLFYTLGGLALITAGDRVAIDAEEAAVHLHSGLVYLPVGLALIVAAALLLTRKAWSFPLGVWLNSLGVVTAVFMFFRGMILRATAPAAEAAAGAAGAARLPVIDGRMLAVVLAQTALFSLAIGCCMRLQRRALEGVARAAAAQTAAGDAILPASRRGGPA